MVVRCEEINISGNFYRNKCEYTFVMLSCTIGHMKHLLVVYRLSVLYDIRIGAREIEEKLPTTDITNSGSAFLRHLIL